MKKIILILFASMMWMTSCLAATITIPDSHTKMDVPSEWAVQLVQNDSDGVISSATNLEKKSFIMLATFKLPEDWGTGDIFQLSEEKNQEVQEEFTKITPIENAQITAQGKTMLANKPAFWMKSYGKSNDINLKAYSLISINQGKLYAVILCAEESMFDDAMPIFRRCTSTFKY